MLTEFYNWLIGNMGTPGDYAYQSIHIWSTVAVMAVFGLVIFLGCRYRGNEIARRRLLLTVAWFHLGFEILWRLIYFFIKGAALKELWPMYPCNLGSVLLPILAIWNIRRGKQLFYLFGFVGSVLTMAIPDGIFSTDVLVFPVLKSILQHTGLLMIPVLELIYGTYRPTLKDMGWVVGGCAIHLLNCEVIDRLLGFTGDYMFLRSGMPFVIPGVPTWITLPVFALLVFALLSILCDWKGSVAFFKSLKKAKVH
jgi:hypothetical integral membrane protein (TIGR02206 family)